MNAAQGFQQAIEAAGMTPQTAITPGKLTRFPGVGKSRGNTNGWAWLSKDGRAGVFGDWASGLSETWQAQHDTKMTAAEREAQKRRTADAQRVRHEEENRAHEEAAQRAQQRWDQAKPAPKDHAYLQRKQIQPHGLRIDHENRLLAPVMIGGEFSSLQFIDASGTKLFLPGGAVKCGSYSIGDLTGATILLIAEGFATAASLYEATGHPAVAAFSAGNLRLVAEQLRHQFPSATIAICGDHDLNGVGRTKATEAAEAVNGLVALPETKGQDFNDVHAARGLDSVRQAIQTVLKKQEIQTMPTARRSFFGGPEGLTKELSDEILRTQHFAKDGGGELYVYEGGNYLPRGAAALAECVKNLLVQSQCSKLWKTRDVREVVEFIKVDAPKLWDRPQPTILNLANGLFDIETGTLNAHSSLHLSNIQLPVRYDPGATCPLWDSFAARVLPSDCQGLTFEIVASAMRGVIDDQRAVLLVGAGENGKSTFLEAVVAFLGRDNISTLALQRLEADKFAVVRLLGKLANVCADLPSESLAGTSTLKALTGGDRLTGERKFQESFDFTPFTRLIFSANHYPRSADASHAFFRRWLAVPFDAVLEPGERIPNLAAKLSSPRELSGVLNRALAVLPGMIHRGGFAQSESTRAALMEFREMTDPLAAWLDRFTVLKSDGAVSKKDLGISYNAAATAAGRPLMTPKAFCSAVRRLRPTLRDGQRGQRGDIKDVFLGIALATQANQETFRQVGSAHSAHFSQIKYTEESTLIYGDELNGLNGLTDANVTPTLDSDEFFDVGPP